MAWIMGPGAWLASLAVCFVLWSAYAIPGNMAGKTHGASVNFLFETLAFIAISAMMSEKIMADLPKVTWTSAAQASLMGLGSALGFYFFLHALNLAPGTAGIALVLLVAAVTLPLQGALFSLFGGDALSWQQWLALAGMISCIVLYNWKF